MKVRKQAPQFTASAYFNKQFKRISLSDYQDRYVVLFFYPSDFTFVCLTEIVQFSDRIDEFKSIGCDILGVSIDSQFSHMKYCKQTRNNGGLGEIYFPLISDLSLIDMRIPNKEFLKNMELQQIILKIQILVWLLEEHSQLIEKESSDIILLMICLQVEIQMRS